jgi:hypothetical protein
MERVSDGYLTTIFIILFKNYSVSVATTYRDISEKDLQKCIDLWTRRMAEGYQDRLLLINAARGTSGYTGTVGVDREEFIGFSAGHLGTFTNLIDIPYSEVETNCELEANQKVGSIDIVCVVEEHEGEGVGTELCAKTATDLEKNDVPLMTQVWHRGGVDGGDVVRKIGFNPVVSLDSYWKYTTSACESCPECRTSPCECRGTLFLKTNGAVMK